MSDVNWWLMALAFVLGLVLTLALTLRRVKREVPVYGALGRRPDTTTGAGAKAAAAGGTAAGATAVGDDATTKLPKAGTGDEPTTQLPKAASPGAAAAGAAAAGAAGAAGAAKFASGGGAHEAADDAAGEDVEVVEETPYGAGSVRVSGAGTPSGYLIKGNEDSMLYHSPESPSYSVTIAEIWFADVESAEKAGFNRWDSGKSQREKK
ncbi:hypothetical protein [Mycobacterium sp. DBP42]|uniref:channel accessory protein ArfC, sunset domain variant n=1 Tax=Mycobacterium sp. DBP42 TaxID=2545267 RepID=UPI00110D03A8|nr:hypothetical protein [Mycobacterium sp. DBP42]TMS49198.1 hypothetical protein E0T84_26255 [Mycobacterium sp. DBP42]